MPSRPLACVVLLVLAAAVAAAGCGGPADAGDAALRVVATTQHVGDFARQVGGARVHVDTLLAPGADPHDYEPRPSDARAVAEADVVLRSGGALDVWLEDVVQSAGGDAEQVVLIDAVRTRPGAEGESDPHWWQDPRNVVAAAERIGAAFAAADPDGAAAYRAGARRYARAVRALDAEIARCMASIPAARRKLVTNHDAFGYLAARYDIDVLGSIAPALSTSAQPSAGDVRRLVAAIRREHVTTIFPESALSQKLERAVARDAGAKVGPALYADTLGRPGSEGATYLGALRHDAAALVAGFGGECELPRP
jgi:ABC-type Zn uptake system ZnuABC Zn-binding protein ZnuA